MRDTLIIALEASWELDPVLMEDILWQSVEQVSNTKVETPYLSADSDICA